MAVEAAGQQKLGHYELIREAGRGGMSVVYEARDSRMGRRVAVKAVTVPQHLSPTQSEGLLGRMRREVRAVAGLSHPNIVSIHDVGEEGGHHFLVMEFLDGQTLRRRLQDGPFSPAEASRILDQVAGALDAVHAAGIVHRDIKSSNVMLLPDGRAKLMDFGIARQVDDTLVTQAGMMVGSPAYMAPELIDGADATVASDLWSLGVLLYEMLAGRQPFNGKTIPAVLYQVAHNPAPPLASVSPAVQKVLSRALDKDPARRYASAGDLAAAFRDALAPPQRRPVVAAAVPASKAIKRTRPRAAWGAAALLLAAVAGGLALNHARPPASATKVAAAPQAKPRPTRILAPPRHPAIPSTKPNVRVADARQERRVAPRHHRRRHLVTPLPVREVKKALVVAPVVIPAVHHARRVHRTPELVAVVAPRPTRHVRRLAALPLEPRHLRHRLRPVPVENNATPQAGAPATSMLGTWRGTHTRNPATLTVTRARPGGFDGFMTVRTHEALVRVAVTGRVNRGRVTMRETRVLSQSRPRAWDLGSESGQIGAGGQMAGSGSDVRGRSGRWSFSR